MAPKLDLHLKSAFNYFEKDGAISARELREVLKAGGCEASVAEAQDLIDETLGTKKEGSSGSLSFEDFKKLPLFTALLEDITATCVGAVAANAGGEQSALRK